jgi:hypothetical protein
MYSTTTSYVNICSQKHSLPSKRTTTTTRTCTNTGTSSTERENAKDQKTIFLNVQVLELY